MISSSGYEHYQYGAGGELVKRFSRSGSEFYSNVEIDGLFQYNNRLNLATDHQNKINVLDSSGNTVAQRRMGSAMGEASYTSDELYMLHNHTGSIIGTYDLNGAQQEGEDFYPFGETAHNWNGNKMHRFGGKLRSFSSGFYLFGARQYAPWLAKFTSVDPLAAKSTDRNPYHYASNNPINRTDPTGMSDGKGDGKGGGKSAKATASGDNATTQKTPVHQVKKGETLSSIAKQHGTIVDKLREANNLSPSSDRKLQVGTQLNISNQDSSTASSGSYNKLSSTVPSEIMGRYGVKMDETNLANRTERAGIDDLLAKFSIPSAGTPKSTYPKGTASGGISFASRHADKFNDEFAPLSSKRLEVDFDWLDSVSLGTDAIGKSRIIMPGEIKISKEDQFNKKATSQRNTGEATNSSPIDAAGTTQSFTNSVSRPNNQLDTITSIYGPRYVVKNGDTIEWSPTPKNAFYRWVK
jgi:RHS repeat-associated protein